MRKDRDKRTPKGRIVTFYSYKGGTGRSMAVANIAWALALSGQRVLVIDWDLEAPGIHRYFHPFLDDKELVATQGLLDFVEKLAGRAAVSSEPLAEEDVDVIEYVTMLKWPAHFAVNWRTFGEFACIDLLVAGRQGPSYGQKLNSFSWIDFYEKLGGRRLLNIVREQLIQTYDYVLIDSRTGVSDTSGICTVEMPDTLVVCFTLNDQSIVGASGIITSVLAQRQSLSRSETSSGVSASNVLPTMRSALRIFPVPTRVEIVSEHERRQIALDFAKQKFAPFIDHLADGTKAKYWGGVQLAYFPFYAFEEIPAIFGDPAHEELSLSTPLKNITRFISGDAFVEAKALSPNADEAELLRKEILGWYLRSKGAVGSVVQVVRPSKSIEIPATRPRRLLAIDGGGLAGLMQTEWLIAIEKQLDDITGRQAPLCDRFDLIGGAGTGAIIAAGLCLGLSATQLRDFYLASGREIFTKTFFFSRLWHLYANGPLDRRVKDLLGDTTLGSDKLRANVLLVCRNVTLGHSWFFSNNRSSQFFANNAKLPLWQIVRASSATPTFFQPQKMSVPEEYGHWNEYEFIDGSTTSHNNLPLQVFVEVTDPRYRFGWRTGSDNLLLISLGTGFSGGAGPIPAGKASGFNILDWSRYSLQELIAASSIQTNAVMNLIGKRAVYPRVLAASEIGPSASTAGGLSDDVLQYIASGVSDDKLLTYQRIAVSLTRDRLDGLSLIDIDPMRVRQVDATDQLANFQRIGSAVAKEQVNMNSLKHFFV